jgi:hypothetical protein
MDATLVELRYNQGFWNKQMVKMAVKKGVITKEQYKTITGEDYK